MTERHTDGLPAERDLPAVRRSVRRDHLMTEFTEHTPRRRPSKGFRRFMTVAVALVLAGGTGVGAATASGVFTVGGAGNVSIVECHATLDADSDSLGFTRTKEDPIAACRKAWQRHEIPHGAGQPPPLVACIRNDDGAPGNVVVFPGTRGSCKKIGLAAAKPPTKEELAYLAKLDAVGTDLERAYVPHCVSDKQLVPVAKASLKRHHLSGWTVKDTFRAGASRCAMAWTDEENNQVVVDNGR